MLPERSRSTLKRIAIARLTPRSIFSYWRLTWRRLIAVFGPPLLVLIIGIVAREGTSRMASARSEGRRSRAVTDATDHLLLALTDAETGQRGFIITGNEEYLSPYLRSVDSVPLAIERLHQTVDSVRPNEATHRAADSLAYFSNEKMTELAEAIRLRRTRGLAAATALVNTDRGRTTMHEARRIAETIRNQEIARIALHSADLTRYTNGVTLIVVVGTSIAFVIALLVNFLLARDAATQTRLAVEGEQARRDAEDANAAKAHFLTTMSHELRTPLNAIAGYVELLEMEVRGPITDVQREDLKRIKRASQHLLALINDVLNYARLDAGTVELHLTDTVLVDVLAEMEALVEPQLRAKEISYEFVPCSRAVRVHVDREKLDQILLNLVGNAVKFTDGGGRITLGCEMSGDTARVVVTDTGRGIPRGKLQSIFDPFVQVDRHLTPDRHQGVGLGLAISRDLARAMHGDITVQSELGKGATFVLSMPLVRATAGVSSISPGEVEHVH